jgi:hypothetical protein
MSWEVVQRKIGKAGGIKQRTQRQREWDRKYGDGQWAVGYFIDGNFVSQDDALESVYFRSYEQHFQEHPGDLEELVRLAKTLRNPHAAATTGVDLQVPAIMDYLRRHGLKLQGNEEVDIGTWDGRCSHSISVRLSPVTIKCVVNPKMTLETFWQEKKCLAVWREDRDET